MTISYSLDWLDAMDGLSQAFDVPATASDQKKIRQASVLLPLFWHQAQWHLLFIRRVVSERDRHSGQVAFPGGRKDDGDTDAVATALREAEEEIGLPRSVAEVLLELDEYTTSSHYRVTPVVAAVPWPYNYRAQPSEVDRIFSIPLSWLSDPSNLSLQPRQLKDRGAARDATVIYYQSYDGEVLWGASARMTIALLRSIHRGELVLPAAQI